VAAGLIAAAPAEDLLVDDRDPPLEAREGFAHRHQGAVQRRRDPLAVGLAQQRDQLADMARPGGDGTAKLRHQPAQGIDQRRALPDQEFAHPGSGQGQALVDAAAACCSSLLIATKRIAGRLTASQIAPTDQVRGLKAHASAGSFLFRRT
jgi:hypothetical protein